MPSVFVGQCQAERGPCPGSKFRRNNARNPGLSPDHARFAPEGGPRREAYRHGRYNPNQNSAATGDLPIIVGGIKPTERLTDPSVVRQGPFLPATDLDVVAGFAVRTLQGPDKNGATARQSDVIQVND